MARIAGIDLPRNKRGEIGLNLYFRNRTFTRSQEVLTNRVRCPWTRKVSEWDDDELAAIRQYLNDHFKTEGALRSEVQLNIKRMMDIGCYRGVRHRCRAYRCEDNEPRTTAELEKGRRKTVANKKKATK